MSGSFRRPGMIAAAIAAALSVLGGGRESHFTVDGSTGRQRVRMTPSKAQRLMHGHDPRLKVRTRTKRLKHQRKKQPRRWRRARVTKLRARK